MNNIFNLIKYPAEGWKNILQNIFLWKNLLALSLQSFTLLRSSHPHSDATHRKMMTGRAVAACLIAQLPRRFPCRLAWTRSSPGDSWKTAQLHPSVISAVDCKQSTAPDDARFRFLPGSRLSNLRNCNSPFRFASFTSFRSLARKFFQRKIFWRIFFQPSAGYLIRLNILFIENK